MKTLNDWFVEYNVSHQNMTNKKIHYVCVPLIFFSVVGLLMSLPSELLQFLVDFHPIIGNWAFITLVLALLFYFRLSVVMGLKMLVFSAFCLIGNYIISKYVAIGWFSLLIFAIGWVGQFYGHKVEGKRPSFFKDLQFLLIGPAWVINSVFSGK